MKQESELVEKALDMQHSKTLALGELAAGIGHEINNPLSILTGNLDLLKKSLRDNSNSPGPKQQLANISQCAERIQNITSGLRRLVRDNTYDALSVIDVNEVARTTVNLLKEIYAKQGISVVIELGQACNVKGILANYSKSFLI